MNKKIARSVISICCTFAMLMSLALPLVNLSTSAATNDVSSITYNFDTESKDIITNANLGNKRTSDKEFTVSDAPDNGTHGKVMGINDTEHIHCDGHRSILMNDGTKFTSLEAGTYKITYDFYSDFSTNKSAGCSDSNKCKTCYDKALRYTEYFKLHFYTTTYNRYTPYAYTGNVYTGSSSTPDSDKTLEASDNLTYFDFVNKDNPVSGWQTDTVYLTITPAMVSNGENYLGLYVWYVPYTVYLDNIQVTKYTPPSETAVSEATFDFDSNNKDFKANGSFADVKISDWEYKVVDAPERTDKALGLHVNNRHNHCGNDRSVMFNNGTTATSLQAGTYKITYDYYAKYIPESHYEGIQCTGSQSPNECIYRMRRVYNNSNWFTLFFYATSKNKYNYSKNTNPSVTSDNLMDMSVVNATNTTTGWQQSAVYITITEDMVTKGENYLALRSWSVPFEVYLDNIKFEQVDVDNPLAFDFDITNRNFKTGNNTIEEERVSGGIYSVVASGSKVQKNALAINDKLTTHNHCDPRGILFNDGSNLTKLDAGTYKIKYSYKADYVAPGGYTGCTTSCKTACEAAYASDKGFKLYFGAISKADFDWASNNNFKPKATSDNLFAFDIVSETVTTSGWLTGEVTIEVTQDMVDNEQNLVALFADDIPYQVYLDDISFERVSDVDDRIIYNYNSRNEGFKVNSKVEDTQVSGGLFRVVNTPTGSNLKTLALNYRVDKNSHCHADPRAILFNDGTKLTKLDAGAYEITYNYYAKYMAPGAYTACQEQIAAGTGSVDNCTIETKKAYNNPQDFRLFFGAIAKGDFIHNSDAYKGKFAYESKNLIQQNVVNEDVPETNGWQTGKVTLVITDEMVEKGQNYLALVMEKVPYEVYLDNIALKRSDVPNDVTVKFDSRGGSAVASTTGLVGNRFTVKPPKLADYQFIGWYLDPGCTQVAEMHYPEADATFYAGWAVRQYKFDFDTVNQNFKANTVVDDVKVSGGVFSVTSDPADSENKVLAVNDKLTTHNHGDGREILFNDGNEAIALKAGTYEIRYRYLVNYVAPGTYRTPGQEDCEYCIAADTAANEYNYVFKFGTVSFNGYNAGATNKKYVTTDNAFLFNDVSSTVASTGWCTNSVIMTVTDDMVAKGQNYLALATEKIPYQVYLDDISVNELEVKDVKISFDSQGGTACDPLYTQTGKDVELPVPTLSGKKFVGWFNYDMKTPASLKGPAQDVTYYAKWEAIPKSFIIDFESTFLAGNSEKYGSGYFKRTRVAGDREHNYFVRYTNLTTDLARVHKLSYNGKLAQIEANKAYKVTFDYYVEQLPASGTFVFDFVTKHNKVAYQPDATRLAGYNLLSDVYSTNTGIVGKWITVETVVYTPEDIGFGYLGMYVADGKGGIVRFDNIKFEQLAADDVVLTYKLPAQDKISHIVGKAGEAIDTSKIPVVDSSALKFEGWFTDKAYTSKFTATTLPAKSTTVYGKASLNGAIHIGFDDYPWAKDTTSKRISSSVMSVEQGMSYDGDGYALKFDNTTEKKTTENKRLLLNLDHRAFPLQDETEYVITYHYYVVSPVTTGAVTVGFYGSGPNSMWENPTRMAPHNKRNIVYAHRGQWITASVSATLTEAKDGCTYLQAILGVPLDSVVYFDDFIVQEVPKGYSAVIYNTKNGTTPAPSIVKTNSSINLPTLKVGKNNQFIGWREGNADIISGKFTVEKTTVLNACIVTEKFTEDFENFYTAPYELGKYGLDTDWELYDSQKEGNSAANVKNGRYSIHRIGKEPGFKAHSMYINMTLSGDVLQFRENYTVTMWVKVENPVHKLGAIEIGNNTTFRHPWAISGETLAIVPIKDIADGEWHQVTYTFTAMSQYLSIYTPGNLSIYFDDITVEYAGSDAAVSTMVGFQEYIPNFLNEDGTYSSDDGSALAEFELVKRTQGSPEAGIPVYVYIISGVAILLVGGGVGTFFVLKRRKTAGGKK